MLNRQDIEIYKESKIISRECFEVGLLNIGEKIETIHDNELLKLILNQGKNYNLRTLPKLQKKVVKKINKNYKGLSVMYSYENEDYIGTFRELRVDTKVCENQYRYDVLVYKMSERKVS